MLAKRVLGANVLTRRELLGMSQDRLAELAGVHRNAIARLEGKKPQWPDEATIRGLAEALGCTERDLFHDPASIPSPEQALKILGNLIKDWRACTRPYEPFQHILDALNGKPERVELAEILAALDDHQLEPVLALARSMASAAAEVGQLESGQQDNDSTKSG